MATYRCHCGSSADVFLRELNDDGRPRIGGKSWAVCSAHVGHVMPGFVGMTIRVSAVSKTWAEHVDRRRAENKENDR